METGQYHCELIGGPGDGHLATIARNTAEIVYQGWVYRVRRNWDFEYTADFTGEKAYSTTPASTSWSI